jgi:hypothetical protein
MPRKGWRIAGQSGQFNQWKPFKLEDTMTVTWVRDKRSK